MIISAIICAASEALALKQRMQLFISYRGVEWSNASEALALKQRMQQLKLIQPDEESKASEALALKQRMQQRKASGNHLLQKASEALALKQRMQLNYANTDEPMIQGFRGTCAETEDATSLGRRTRYGDGKPQRHLR